MLYALTIPGFQQALSALSAELDKAQSWGLAIDVGDLRLITARLAPDMFPLASQIRFTCLQALHPIARLCDQAVPDFTDDAPDFAGMQQQIADTLAALSAVDAAAINAGGGDRPVSFSLPNGMVFDMTAAEYLRCWALPQFYFHRVSAYAVMRHMGVPLGKADYVNYMLAFLRPGTAPTG